MSPGPAAGAGAGSLSQLLSRPLMQQRRRGRRYLRAFKYGAGIFLAYIMLRLRVFDIKEETHLQSPFDSEIVWEFLADFNNMKHLNPTIIDFEIISDKGLYDNWEYSVKYTEFLHNAPFIKNTITADFHVRKTVDGHRYITSTHTTCFFFTLYCVRAWGRFDILDSKITPSSVKVRESVSYECPLAFFWFCKNEAAFQRRQIKENLVEHFDGIRNLKTSAES